MAYPNIEFWAALDSGRLVSIDEDEEYQLSTVDCGVLNMPSGQLVACDPFAGLQKSGNPFVMVSPGQYQVIVTLADVSKAKDGSHIREAYASLLLDQEAKEVKRKIITPLIGDQSPVPPEMDKEGSFYGFPVGAGTACFVDNVSVQTVMPGEDVDWYEEIFIEGATNSWFDLMDDAGHIRNGIANIDLPSASNGENIIIIHSGWGDGSYPVIGGYDKDDRLIRVHIDFMVVFDDRKI